MKYFKRAFKKIRYRLLVSQLAGPKLLRGLAKAHPDLMFVQVGANDGKMMDPIRKVVLKSEWQGWVLEPVPELYEQLRRNYQCVNGRVSAVNVALSEIDGEAEFFHLQSVDGLDPLPEWAAGLGSFDLDIILKHGGRIRDIERHIQKLNVPCLSWESFCSSRNIRYIDLLVSDTEGYDYKVVRQLDFNKYRPFLLVYEHHHFDRDTENSCTKLLAEHGYYMFTEGLDTWAIDIHRPDARYEKLIEKVHEWVAVSPYACVK